MTSSVGLVPIPARISSRDGGVFAFSPETPVVSRSASGAASRIAEALGWLGTSAETPRLIVELDSTAAPSPEGYSLQVTADSILLLAPTDAGLFYGAQTLRQLAAQQPGGITPVDIADFPRYTYRGFMLDVARHFHPVSTVKAVIDRMALLKLNHLHLHLTDDQGWRIEIRSRPKLTELAAQSEVGGGPGGFYTQDDYREIVSYAAERFITVVPEFDMPGHTHAVSLAYPELIEQPALVPIVVEQAEELGLSLPVFGEPYTDYVVGHSSLKTASPEVDAFVADVVREIAELTPGPYLHIGGDECHGTPKDAFLGFVARAARITAATGKTLIGWHEMGACRDLPEDTVGQFWGLTDDDGSASVPTRTFAELGGQVILSPADAIYVDHKYAADDPIGLVWANGPTTVADSYNWEPDELIDGIEGPAILGLEAALWTETVESLAHIDWLMLPRTAAAAAKAWSPRGASEWESFRARVGAQAPLWRGEGIGFFESPEIDWDR